MLHLFYGDSPMRAVSTIFADEHEWLPWKFKKVPSGYWEQKGKSVLDNF